MSRWFAMVVQLQSETVMQRSAVAVRWDVEGICTGSHINRKPQMRVKEIAHIPLLRKDQNRCPLPTMFMI